MWRKASLGLAIAFTASASSALAENTFTLPQWEAALGVGGYFFEANQEYDPGGFYQARGTYNIDPAWSVDAYMAGMPQLNDNPKSGIVPPPADRHNWGLQWGSDVNYHFNQDPGRQWDPFVGLGGGINTFKNDIEGSETHVFGDINLGLAYRLDQIWNVRGDYKAMLEGGDENNRYNQIFVVSLGYNWGNAGGRGGEKNAGDDETGKSVLDNKELGLAPIYFDFDKSDVRGDQKAVLDKNAAWIKAHPDTHIILEGHCDERGTNEYNLALGERRARSAFEYLRSLGVPAKQMSVVSYGEERPADPGHNEAAWAKNRRVECRGK